MPNDNDTSYLLDNINRKLFLIAEFRLPTKADRLIDSVMADVEKLRGLISADSPTNTQAENAEAEGRQT